MSDLKTEIPKELGIEIGGPGRAYFDDVIVDNLFDAVLEVSAAVWTIRDRQIVLEKVLSEKGIDVSADIEAYVPDETSLEERKAERDEMVTRIFKGFMRRPNNATPKSPDAPSLREITD